MTTLHAWTDYELLHEFDKPLFTERNLCTRANIGEVIKGAITPLTQSTVIRSLNRKMQEEVYLAPANPYVSRGIYVESQFLFLDVLNVSPERFRCVIPSRTRSIHKIIIGHVH